MFEYIQGRLIEANPAYAVIENSSIGYFLHISVNTFIQIKDKESVKLFIHQVIREDAHMLYGFYDRSERDVFRHLISIGGIGPNTARMILSSLTPQDVHHAVQENQVSVLQSVKGIGLKSAQRIIIELKDKLTLAESGSQFLGAGYNTEKDEALSALIMLGFSKHVAEKALTKVLNSSDSALKVEELIKEVLKIL